MKSAAVATGAFALGVAALYGQNASTLTPQERNKWWIVSGSLRMFYDDNMFNAHSSVAEGSFGVEVKPGVAVNLPLAQTLISGSYDYTMSFFEGRESSKVDQTHLFDGRLNHRFSERYNLTATENFAISDEPVVSSGPQNVFRRRQDASNMRHLFGTEVSGLVSPIVGWLVGYDHYLQDYKTLDYSSTLDQQSHAFHVDGRWFPKEKTLLYAGYRLGFTEYTYGRPIGRDGDGFLFYADIKNNRNHRFYVGGRQELNPKLNLTSRVGFQFTDYYNDSASSLSPYLDVSATYRFLPDSSLSLSINVDRYAADVTGALDQLIVSPALGVSHQITPRITGTMNFRYQNATLKGGSADGVSDDYFAMSLGAEYKIRENVFAALSYNWSKLVSGRSEFFGFSRNQVFWGVRASY